MSQPSSIPTELPLWLQLNKVSKKYMDALAAKLGHIGTRRHYFLLTAIGESEGKLTQQELADLLETDKVTMVGILDSLDRSGFIRRTRSKVDRRKQMITLTAKAERHLPKIKRVISELNRKALSGLPSGLSRQFLPALADMKAQLEEVIANAEAHESESDAPRPGRKPGKRAAA